MATPDDLSTTFSFSLLVMERACDILKVLEYNGDFDVPKIWHSHPKGYVDTCRFGIESRENMLTCDALSINLDGALHYAVDEIAEIAPESRESIKRGMWRARTAIRSSPNWEQRKNRVKSKGAVVTIRNVIASLVEQQQ
ncbi:hypothetical protein VCRA2110O2_30300 [Vibrio crassostreae]|nr:hypothetical protein VCHA44O286_50076 [Vibrio chagasii]CAK2871291.1 hypothetical protein VCRA2110O2_30300 [Vibrio crassostreae]